MILINKNKFDALKKLIVDRKILKKFIIYADIPL